MSEVKRIEVDGSDSYKIQAQQLLHDGFMFVRTDTSELPHQLIFCMPYTPDMKRTHYHQIRDGILQD